jgi:tetratricopeptide (TPR) repeat protein
LAADKHNERAESFYREGRLDDAINLTKMLLVCYPYQRNALVNMGLYYFKKGDWDTAEKWCRKLLTSTSENGYRAQAYYNLSLIYEKKKQPEIAQRYLFISYYLRPHPIVEKALLKKDATLTLPQKYLPHILMNPWRPIRYNKNFILQHLRNFRPKWSFAACFQQLNPNF